MGWGHLGIDSAIVTTYAEVFTCLCPEVPRSPVKAHWAKPFAFGARWTRRNCLTPDFVDLANLASAGACWYCSVVGCLATTEECRLGQKNAIAPAQKEKSCVNQRESQPTTYHTALQQHSQRHGSTAAEPLQPATAPARSNTSTLCTTPIVTPCPPSYASLTLQPISANNQTTFERLRMRELLTGQLRKNRKQQVETTVRKS